MRLRIGTDINGANGIGKDSISVFRLGNRSLGTISTSAITGDPTLEESASGDMVYENVSEIVIDEKATLFKRDNDPHLSTGAYLYVPMMATNPGTYDYYLTSGDETIVSTVPTDSYIEKAASEKKNEIGLSLKVYREDSLNSTSKVYFDNAMWQVSNILWEFSPDGGDTWYQFFDLPNRAYRRMTLPRQTTKIRARALSNTPGEWVQAFAITPVPDFQGVVRSTSMSGSIVASDDGFGYLTWNNPTGGIGNILYEIYCNGEQIGATRNIHYQLGQNQSGTFYIIAQDEAGTTIQSNNIVIGGQSGYVYDSDETDPLVITSGDLIAYNSDGTTLTYSLAE